MVIRVYVASSTGSVAVSVYKPACDSNTFLTYYEKIVIKKKYIYIYRYYMLDSASG